MIVLPEIKIIMSDLDGTLLTTDRTPSKDTLREIARVKERGILFGLATGRAVASVEKNLDAWGLTGLVDIIVGMNGTEIKDNLRGEHTTGHLLKGAYIREIVALFQDMEVNFAINEEKRFITLRDDALIGLLSGADRLPYHVVDLDTFAAKPQTKLILICDRDYMPMVQQRCDENLREGYYGIQTGTILFEYMDTNVSKSLGLQDVVARHGLSMENVLAFGDADNDHDMIRDSGIGVVMANGSDRTKSVTDALTKDNNNNGVACYLREYFA